MVNRAAYKGDKRQKEVARQKKAEEKRQRRQAKNTGRPDGEDEGNDVRTGAAGADEAKTDQPAEPR
jgi:hypothetical protein